MAEKVFVTGYGIVSALGTGAEATLQALLATRSGIAPVEILDTDHRDLPVGEVKMTNGEMAQMLGAKAPVSELRTVLMGMIAAKEAVAHASLTPEEIGRAAFISGTTVGGMDKTEKHFKSVLEENARTEETLEMGFNDCGCSTEMIADSIGKVCMLSTTSTACSSAANAVILGANLIKAGVVDIAIVGGSEALTKFHLNGFNTLMILDKERCRPFDAGRTGINLGEGAAYLVIESAESAMRRGVQPLATLSGYANTCDAFHQTASSENGEGAFLAMRKAMDNAGLSPRQIDYINAHGTGTPNNDVTEFAAMERIWNGALPPFSSTKSLTGHTTSASGAIESVICLLAMQHGFLPANLGWAQPLKPGAGPVHKLQTGVEIHHVINNSFGFGGNDSTLIFSKN